MAKVLVVDDSTTVREQVAQTLAQAGYEVLEAFDGVDAGEKLARHGDVALVLCDLHMPRQTGLELLEELRLEARRPPLTVVMLTSEGQPELVAKAKSLGAKGWMLKPVAGGVLVATVEKLMGAAPARA
jgi:two-component system chemotaxis response regulator CheY